MARIFMDGWEHGKPSSVAISATGDYNDSMWQFHHSSDKSDFSVNTTSYPGGAYSLMWKTGRYTSSFGPLTDCAYKNLGGTYNKLFSRFYFSKSAGQQYLERNYYHSIISFDDTTYFGNSMSMQLKVNVMTNAINLFINGASVSIVSDLIIDNTWHLIEVMYDSTGSNVVVRVDNAIIINYSGTIDPGVQYVSLFKTITSETNYSECYYYIDDFALNDDSGSVNNSWIGAGVIRLIKPTSDDTNTDFTPSTGSDHYALVDDFPDDGDTTYNSSTVSGDIDTFGLESVPSVATGQTINAVQAVYRAKSETDVASVAPILISGATLDTGATQSTVLSDYNDTKQKVYDVDPNTSAQWTEANVNAVKGGYKNAT